MDYPVLKAPRVAMEPDLKEYRSMLVAAEQAAQEQYDKTVLALSGGAFGISFAFVERFIDAVPIGPGWLLAAWVCWGLSIAAIVFSFLASTLAIRKALGQVDANRAYEQTPGGVFSTLVLVLNSIGGFLFVVGALMIVRFVAINL